METSQELPTVTATPASQWKKKIDDQGTPLELPSGNVALCKQITPLAFVTGGMIPDPLTGLITQAINEKRGVNPAKLKALTENTTDIVAALEMFDRVLTNVVIEPPIEMPPTCAVSVGEGLCGEYANTPVHKDTHRSGHHAYREGRRDPNVLYADIVDMDDKMFIFQWALGGTHDLQQFREEQAKRVESLSDGEDVPGAPVESGGGE